MATLLGGTVGELKRRMSNVEFRGWLAYRAKWGPLDVVRRYDRPAALGAHVATVAAGGKGKMQDMMPWPILEPLSEAEQFARELMGHG